MDMHKIIENQPHTSPKLISGLGGWLILSQVSLWSIMITAMFQLCFNISRIISQGHWMALAYKQSSTYGLWVTIVSYEIIGRMLVLAALAFGLALFYRKRQLLPTYLFYFYMGYAIYLLSYYFMIQYIQGIQDFGISYSPKSLITSLIMFMVWAMYYRISERVRNTFVK